MPVATKVVCLNVLEASLSNSLNQSDLSLHCLPLYFYSSEKSIKHAADDLSRQHFQMKFFSPGDSRVDHITLSMVKALNSIIATLSAILNLRVTVDRFVQ